MKRVKVLEVDQWTSVKDVEGTKIKDWRGQATVREVLESTEPPKGYVWFKPDKRGVLRRWKSNYDSSD